MIWGIFIGLVILGLLLLKHMHDVALIDHVKENTFEFSNFPQKISGFTIFFITDIHRRNISDAILEKAKGKVDLVIIGGDLTERGVAISQTSNNLRKLKTIAPTIFIWGNNDYEVDGNQLTQTLQEHGVSVLKNDIFYKYDEQIAIIGLDDLTQELPPLEPIFKKTNAFQILLCHNPATICMIPEENQISLALCGHTHGGQIRIFGLGPYKIGGLGKIKDITTLISNGYGTSMLPLRLGAKPETHLITIRNSKMRN